MYINVHKRHNLSSEAYMSANHSQGAHKQKSTKHVRGYSPDVIGSQIPADTY